MGINEQTGEISPGQTLTDKEAYEAMIRFLYNFVEFTGSKDLTDILSGGEYIAPNCPADSAFWYYWEEAIEYVKGGGEPLMKRWVPNITKGIVKEFFQTGGLDANPENLYRRSHGHFDANLVEYNFLRILPSKMAMINNSQGTPSLQSEWIAEIVEAFSGRAAFAYYCKKEGVNGDLVLAAFDR